MEFEPTFEPGIGPRLPRRSAQRNGAAKLQCCNSTMSATLIGTRFTTPRCLGAIGLLSSLSAVGTIGSPTLLSQPLMLVVLSPRLPFLALAASQVSPLLLVPIVVARLCAGDVFHFHLGAHGAHRLLTNHRLMHHRRLSGMRRAVTQSNVVTFARTRYRSYEALARNGVLVAVLLRPIGRHLALAGAAGACPRRVAIADLVGTFAYVLVVVLSAHSLTR